MTTAQKAVDSLPTVEQGIPWFSRELTKLIGPMLPDRFVLVGAMPGNGKTAFALNLLDHLIHKSQLGVLYCSTEVSPETLWKQWAGLRLGIEVQDMDEGRWRPASNALKVEIEIRKLDQWRCGQIHLPDDLVEPDVPHLTTTLFAAHEGVAMVDIVIVDHIHRISAGTRSSKWEKLDASAQWLADLAHGKVSEHPELHVARPRLVVAFAQLKREGLGIKAPYTTPTIESFQGCSALEQNCDIALGLSRKLKPMTTSDIRDVREGRQRIEAFQEDGVMVATCLKHRLRGSARDRSKLLRVDAGRIRDATDRDAPGSGDAWEAEEELPF